ncbi:MAG: PIN domain-containing protein [Candidatus Nanopelagicales bacterium]|nr:PIN domain-containing protein [Candidatus Nanopelagicales bacterium]
MIILDTGAMFSYLVTSDPHHEDVASIFAANRDGFVLSPFVIAELDYFVMTRLGVSTELVLLADIASGAYELPVLSAADLIACAGIIEKYADQWVGVTDASLVVLAERYQTRRICTLDHRHFGVMRASDGTRFELLP